jgi:flagellar hook protein FlgE
MSFQQGLSGLNASSKNLEIIGNNIANANTYGTKTSRAEFSDVYAAALNGAGSNAIGLGTSMTTVAQQFTQGVITTTENPMDLAINGSGFFQLTDGKSPTTYSRNGQFKVDRDGFIINGSGLQLMGYAASPQGVIQPGQAVPLQLPTGGVPPNASTGIDIEMNLDSRLTATVPPSGPAIDFNDGDTYNKATAAKLFDAKGQEVAMTFYFQKAATDTWNVFATANGQTVLGVTGAPDPIATINFPSDGRAPTSPVGPVFFDIPATTSAAGLETLPIANFSFDIGASTQFASAFTVTDITQDGNAPGQLSGISVEDNGIITARYSNGESRAAGQVEIANFRNPQGLQPLGNNQWADTFASGDPVKGVPGDGSLGVLQAGALEESNVDLTGELVNMITAQRIYQANAQTIKAQDQVLQTLVNIR